MRKHLNSLSQAHQKQISDKEVFSVLFSTLPYYKAWNAKNVTEVQNFVTKTLKELKFTKQSASLRADV